MAKTRFVLFAFLLFLAAYIAQPVNAAPKVYTAELNGIVDPSTALYIQRAIRVAERNNAQAFIIIMDTPGGLVSSAREIITSIFGSDIPVIVYVSPSAAQATSAGSLISLSANVIAMAPGTTIGAAHPVDQSGNASGEKVTNVVASYARSIATRRGRDVKLAEKLVRHSISLTTDEAIKQKLADIKATSLDDLLTKLNGRKVDGQVLQTAKATVVPVDRTVRERFLHVLADPNIAYILLLLGFYGMIFELSNPGAVFPGVVGGICLIMAFYSLSVLPINTAGILLMVLALILFIADIKVPSHGVLTIGGIVSFLLGSLMLFESSAPVLRASITLIVMSTLVTTAFFAFAVGAGIRAQKRKVTTGKEGMIGQLGEARTNLDPQGKVFFEGTYWTAVSSVPIHAGQQVRVVEIDGLTLRVEPVSADLKRP